MTLTSLVSIVVMLLGFGFVIFWHELGHFLGARWAGVRVEQFAVGMGHALVSYRKGIGLRLGNTRDEFERRVAHEFDRRNIDRQTDRERMGLESKLRNNELSPREKYDIARDLGIGETEYRLSMLPIGGYVKPTGQDDLRPAKLAAADDPHSYAAAPVGKRMVIISAGVIMNVILAAILFFVLFYVVGFDAQRAVVGQVQSGSPAAAAGLRAGDELLDLNGHALADFTKVLMNVGLLPADRAVPLTFKRDGEARTIMVRPRSTSDNSNMLALGFSPAPELQGLKPDDPGAQAFADELAKQATPDPLLLRPGERVAAIDGAAVGVTDYAVLDRAIQNAAGRPIALTILNDAGASRTTRFVPEFAATFDRRPLAFAGLMPRTRIVSVPADKKDSAAAGILKNGDVILSILQPGGPTTRPIATPTADLFRSITTEAGGEGRPLVITVSRDGQTIELPPIVPTTKIAPGTYGLGVALANEQDRATVAAAAAATGIEPGATITAFNGRSVASWADVHRAIVDLPGPAAVEVATVGGNGVATTRRIDVSQADVEAARDLRYANPLAGSMREWRVLRKTSNPLEAMAWGVGETRDLILQGYLTIRRVFGGSVPASNMSGPVGIFRAGTGFAERGPDWFIWFLALISANLAVVNFLPVPILDGWHFLSLLKEKVTGRPVSERVQEYAQLVGLAMILSLIVFVTYNDIMRW